jgi:heptosyltransferase-2
MKYAHMNFVNDSAPMHFASAMNAPVAAVYCSTVPEFGYGPLSDIKYIFSATNHCIAGHADCMDLLRGPEGHFKCALEIEDEQLLEPLRKEEEGRGERGEVRKIIF